ncbi:hypothetical protein [Streptomyces sp. NPDC017202]|uniref:hypothetical protein n=1 Tax=Streptomyces sp. NPDC017202 TaxID=3364981 RepID=UPI003797C2FF
MRHRRVPTVLWTARFLMVPDTSVTNVSVGIGSCASARLAGSEAAVPATGGVTPADFPVTRHPSVGDGVVRDGGGPAPTTTRPGRRSGPRRRP